MKITVRLGGVEYTSQDFQGDDARDVLSKIEMLDVLSVLRIPLKSKGVFLYMGKAAIQNAAFLVDASDILSAQK